MTETAPAPTEPAPTEPPLFFRWGVLLFVSLAMFGNYYIYDAISPLADLLKEQLAFSDSQIGWMNAIYSAPNIIMVLIGGLIIDRIGTKRATLLFAVLCFLGAVVTGLMGNFYLMAAGRLIFGLGAESLIVAVTTCLAKWFRGKELSFAFGLNLTIARLGSFAALNSPSWAKSLFDSWQLPLVLTMVAGMVSVVCGAIYWLLENRAETRYSLGAAGETEKIVWRDLLKFSRSYWFVVALCITFYSAIFPFQTFAVKFFMEAHGTTRELGGFLNSLLTLFAMVATPLFGLWVDKVGKRALFMMYGSLLLIPVYLIMAYVRASLLIEVPVVDYAATVPHVSPWLSMSIMGIAFSLIPAVMWPSVAYIVEQSKHGTAYGLMTMIQNIGLFGFNVLIGWANDFWQASPTNPGGYAPGMWIFSCLGFFGVLFAFLLRRAETGPDAHGLETITAGSKKQQPAGNG